MRPSSWLSALAGALVLTGAGGIASVAWRFALPWDAIAWLLALGGGLGFVVAEGAGTLVWFWDASAIREHTYAKADLMRADADAKRAALDRHAAPPHATREEPPGAREDDERPDLDLRWLAACHRFLVAADRHGWQIRRLVGLGIVEWDGWTDITNVLRDAGVVVKTSRTGWADGWSMEAWQEKKHSLVLPYPKDTEPPTVVIVTTTMLQQANNTRPEVVEGVRAD